METVTSLYNNVIIKDQIDRTLLYHDKFPVDVIQNKTVFERTNSDMTENFSDYLDWLHLVKGSGLMVLSSSKHYYYEAEDLNGVKILVNLKILNYIKQTRDFFHNIYCVLPLKSHFIGCFYDNKYPVGYSSDRHKSDPQINASFDPTENGITSRIPFLNMMYNIIDSRTNRYMTKRTVTLYLEESLLKVLDMTVNNGLTYFCAQKDQNT